VSRQQLWQVLKQCHQVHVRWARREQYQAVSPFSSRVSPGLHVFYSPVPSSGSSGLDSEALCTLLKKVFDSGLGCESPEVCSSLPPLLSHLSIEWVLRSLLTWSRNRSLRPQYSQRDSLRPLRINFTNYCPPSRTWLRIHSRNIAGGMIKSVIGVRS
jgi:hypothetical protein